MNLPNLSEPERYCGLYLYDFGEWSAVGYTADEIAILLESEKTRGGKIYRIVRARPNGQVELKGVPPERFELESGMFFARSERDAATLDYDTLRACAETTPPPCRCFLHLADRGADTVGGQYVIALIYPAEYEDDMGRWLLDVDYAGGDIVEGGPSHVTDYYNEDHTILQRQQLWSAKSESSRSADEVLSSIRRVVQR